jgi:hypothetical protein
MSDVDMAGISGRDVALLAHRAAISEIAEIQQRIALRQIMRPIHGDRTLPIQEFFRRTLGGLKSLTTATELTASEAKLDTERLAKLYAIVEALEATFAAQKEQQDREFFESLANYLARTHSKKD